MHPRVRVFIHKGMDGAKQGTLNSFAWIVALLVSGWDFWQYDAYYIVRGFDWNLLFIKEVTGWIPWGGKVEAFLRFINAEKALLVWEIKTLVKYSVLALGRFFLGAWALSVRIVDEKSDTRVVASKASLAYREHSSNSSGQTQGVTTMQIQMRSSGWRRFNSLAADIMWILTVPAVAVLVGLLPQVGNQPAPFFGTVTQALIYLSVPMTLALVLFNGLSGRWPAPEFRRWNTLISGLAFFALGVIIFVLYFVHKGATGLPVLTATLPAPVSQTFALDMDLIAKTVLFGLTLFALVDWKYTKGQDYLATSSADEARAVLQEENENLREQVQGLQARLAGNRRTAGSVVQSGSSQVGIERSPALAGLANHLSTLGPGVKIGPFTQVYLKNVPGIGLVLEIRDLDVLELRPTRVQASISPEPPAEGAKQAG